MLNEECPASKDRDIKVFFTDVMDIEEDRSDRTSETLMQIYTYAKLKPDFACEQTVAVTCGDWEKLYGQHVKLFNDNLDRLPREGGYQKLYKDKFDYYITMSTVDKKSLTQEQFDDVGKSL